MHALIPKSAVALSVATGLFAYCVVARADHRIETVIAVPSITVNYRELDISKPWGLEVLYSRIQNAAKSVCNFDHSLQQLSRAHSARACYQSAVENAVSQINRPTLTAYHRAKMKEALG